MKNGEYTLEDEVQMGTAIANILQLRHAQDRKNQYKTTWGNKTAVGILAIIRRIAKEINNGNQKEIEETLDIKLCG